MCSRCCIASAIIFLASAWAPTTSFSRILGPGPLLFGISAGADERTPPWGVGEEGPPGLPLMTFGKARRWYDAHLLMGKVVILGCGYVGRLLARRLVARGDPVLATTTTEAKLDQL